MKMNMNINNAETMIRNAKLPRDFSFSVVAILGYLILVVL